MTKRLYSLFEKQEGKWVRISPFSYYKTDAVRIYQNALLKPYTNWDDTVKGIRCLKVVK